MTKYTSLSVNIKTIHPKAPDTGICVSRTRYTSLFSLYFVLIYVKLLIYQK